MLILGGIAILLLAMMWTQTTSTSKMGFTPSLDKGKAQISDDMVITYTKATSAQPLDIYPFFRDLSASNVKLYKYDYVANSWVLWYNTEFVNERSLQDTTLNNLDPAKNAYWDGFKWETKILVAPISTDARFSYTSTDLLTSGYGTAPLWETQSVGSCVWGGNTYHFGSSFCVDGYLWVCYAGEAGTNSDGFKSVRCDHGCYVDTPLEESYKPTAFCKVAPTSCFYIPFDATVAESLKATDCESRGGRWDWCVSACYGPETCFDGVMNQGEEGVDCGGPCDAECSINVPIRTPSCYDGIQNQGEEGVDCGGPCDLCKEYPAQATCYDGIKNQGEAGIDCGGPCLPCDDTYRPRPVTTPNNKDCKYASLPTLSISTTEECPTEYVCTISSRGFLNEMDAIQDCNAEAASAGISAPTVIVNQASVTYRDASGNAVCPNGAQPKSWEEVNNACAFKPEAILWVVIFLVTLSVAFGMIRKKTNGGK